MCWHPSSKKSLDRQERGPRMDGERLIQDVWSRLNNELMEVEIPKIDTMNTGWCQQKDSNWCSGWYGANRRSQRNRSPTRKRRRYLDLFFREGKTPAASVSATRNRQELISCTMRLREFLFQMSDRGLVLQAVPSPPVCCRALSHTRREVQDWSCKPQAFQGTLILGHTLLGQTIRREKMLGWTTRDILLEEKTRGSGIPTACWPAPVGCRPSSGLPCN